MESWAIAILIKPFVLLLGWVVFCYPALRFVRRMKDGKLKSLLLRPIGKQSTGSGGR